jgi:glutaredoxin
MSHTINIFTMMGCKACERLKIELNEQNIPHKVFDINEHKTIWDEIRKQTGQDAVPTLYVKEENEDKGLVYAPFRDYKNHEDLMKIIKKYI